MQPSDRISNLLTGGSDGWEVFNRAREMIAAGDNVIELTIGEHDVRTDPVILEAMHYAALAGHTGYASVPGIKPLREEVARRTHARTGVPTRPENVVITPGGQAALFAAHIAACEPGDRSLFIDPYYATYPGTIRGAGCVPIAIAARPELGFQPTAQDISIQAADAASLMINTPNNPTGVVYSQDTIGGISNVVRDHGLWLISDEVYDTQIWHGEHVSPRAFSGMEDCTLVVGSMSKSHAMTGSRIGWVIGPDEVVDKLITLSTHTTYGVPGFIQDAALFALEQGTALEEKIAAPFRRRRDLALRLLERQNIVRAVPCAGAMYMMLDIRATGLSGIEFANAFLDDNQIAVMPGESFGQAAAGHLRVAMTVADDMFEYALNQLISFAEGQTS